MLEFPAYTCIHKRTSNPSAAKALYLWDIFAMVSITWDTSCKIYLDKLTDFPRELPRIILKKKKKLNPVFLCI